ncbi:MAG: hypothetical protein AB7E49_10145 [Campylobacterales bacterium]
MQITPSLKAKMTKAVEVSMRIEGYKPADAAAKQAAKILMEKHGVKVSVRRK